MAEDKYTEYKETWRDEYLRQICGLANTCGGSLFVGLNDRGEVVGVRNAKKLQEDIPNKVKDTLGIVPDVICHATDGKEYLEVAVPANASPVNYRNKFYYRSGSVTIELTDTALHTFLLEKLGGRWDSTPIDNVSVDELDKASFDIFRRRAVRSGRMTREDVDVSNAELLDRLNLIAPDGRLKRAAVLLFHARPEKWVAGAFTKIGRFTKWEDLRYQDEVHGSLLWQAEHVIDLIFTKYLIANISYEGVTRVETFPYPLEAMREALYNALMHNAYEADTPLQIRIDYDAMYISNDLRFNSQLTAEKLMLSHKSQPTNPAIANVFYRAGFVEAWGRGIKKMCQACEKWGCQQPTYIVDATSLMLRFAPLFIQDDLPTEKSNTANEPTNEPANLSAIAQALLKHCPSIAQALPKHLEFVAEIVSALRQPKSMQEIVADLNVSRDRLRRNFLPLLIKEDIVQLTNPGNPRDMRQRYCLTDKGMSIVEAIAKGTDSVRDKPIHNILNAGAGSPDTQDFQTEE